MDRLHHVSQGQIIITGSVQLHYSPESSSSPVLLRRFLLLWESVCMWLPHEVRVRVSLLIIQSMNISLTMNIDAPIYVHYLSH